MGDQDRHAEFPAFSAGPTQDDQHDIGPVTGSPMPRSRLARRHQRIARTRLPPENAIVIGRELEAEGRQGHHPDDIPPPHRPSQQPRGARPIPMRLQGPGSGQAAQGGETRPLVGPVPTKKTQAARAEAAANVAGSREADPQSASPQHTAPRTPAADSRNLQAPRPAPPHRPAFGRPQCRSCPFHRGDMHQQVRPSEIEARPVKDRHQHDVDIRASG